MTMNHNNHFIYPTIHLSLDEINGIKDLDNKFELLLKYKYLELGIINNKNDMNTNLENVIKYYKNKWGINVTTFLQISTLSENIQGNISLFYDDYTILINQKSKYKYTVLRHELEHLYDKYFFNDDWNNEDEYHFKNYVNHEHFRDSYLSRYFDDIIVKNYVYKNTKLITQKLKSLSEFFMMYIIHIKILLKYVHLYIKYFIKNTHYLKNIQDVVKVQI